MAEAGTHAPLRILHVEDSPADLELVELALTQSGVQYVLEGVTQQEEFARRIAEREYDVILSDYNLGSWTGRRALEIVRQAGCDIPFILVTGTIGDTLASELIKQGVSDYVLKNHLGRLAPAIRGALADRTLRAQQAQAEAEIRRINADLEQRVEVRTVELQQAVAQLQREIDERLRVEEWLRESEERLSMAVRSAEIGVWNWDVQGNRIVWDDSMHQLFGIPPGTFSERLEEFYNRLHPDDCERVAAEVARVLETAGDYSAHFRILLPNGSERELTSRGRVYRDAGGRAARITGVTWDVTERRKAEIEILRAKDLAEQANQLKDQFLSTVSHELRTPLNAILGYAQMLSDARQGPLNERQDKFVKYIYQGGQHLLSLINDILDLSKIETGRMELAIEDLDLPRAFSEVQETMQPLAEKRAQQLVVECPPRLGVRADARRFRQILMNLVGNAIKFSPEGARVQLRARREGRFVQLGIHDGGPGIPEEKRELIFHPFYRLPGKAAKAEGTGLGLPITRRLVELHGANLRLESQLGQGTHFFFELPAVDLPVPRTVPRPADCAHQRILVIEDDPAAARLISAQLQTAGYVVEACLRSQDALLAAVERQPDLITLDVIMAPINGWQLLLQLKQHPATRHIPVVLLTIVDQPAMGLTLGASEYLVKPVEREALLSAVARCLGANAGGKRRVLLVEDDPHLGEFVRESLQEAGYDVGWAQTVGDARRLAAEQSPALVVLDLILPDASGFQLLGEWRAQPELHHVPVVVLTGKELSSGESAYLSGHTSLVFQKQRPWQQELLAEIRRLIPEKELEPR
jgi:PAS domain S-box-containing protein